MHATIVTPYPLKSLTLRKALKRENIESITFSPKSLAVNWREKTDTIILPNYMSKKMWKHLGSKLFKSLHKTPIILFGKMHEALYESEELAVLERCIFLDESIPLSQIPQLVGEIISSSKIKTKRNSRIKVKDFVLDRDRRLISFKGKNRILRKKEFFLLELLMSNAGQVTTRERIVDFVWNKRNFISQNTIDVYIHRLRSKLKPISLCDPIETVSCLGYIFKAM